MTAATGTRPHGTRARYVLGPGPGTGPGCRCDLCTAANREAERRRERQILYGRWEPYVDAAPARDHLRALAAAGIGWKRAAQLARVSTGSVSKLLYGGPGDRPPSRRIRPQTAAAILTVSPSAQAVAPGALVDSGGTRRRVQALVTRGWSQARLACQLAVTGSNFATMMRREQVTAATARAVGELYDRLWDKPPPESNQRERIAAARARNYAAERGWAPPLAWDDDIIDDPSGRPAERWKRPAHSRGRRRPRRGRRAAARPRWLHPRARRRPARRGAVHARCGATAVAPRQGAGALRSAGPSRRCRSSRRAAWRV